MNNSNPSLLCIAFFLALIGFVSCKSDQAQTDGLSGPELLDATIAHYGGDGFFKSKIEFNVDDLRYTLIRDAHLTDFTVARIVDSTELIGRYRNGYQEYFVNGVKQEEGTYNLRILNAKLDGFTYTFSIPHNLKQNAIIAERKADQLIRGTNYHVLHTYSRPIEGEPQDEIYLYIHPDTYDIHFTAEQLVVTGGNPIFKRYHNFRRVDSLLFADHYSFVFQDSIRPLAEMYTAFQDPHLRNLQHVELTDISVKYTD